MFRPVISRFVLVARYAFLLIALATVVSVGGAQTARGAITGTVKDNAGAVIAGAKVTLTSPSTGVTTELPTNSAGVYRFNGVTPGDYVVHVSAPGFQTQEQAATVVVGALVGREFTLAVGSTGTVVEVSATSSELQTEDAVRGATISTVMLQELPIAGQNSANLLLTVPGVTRSNTGTANDNGIGSVNGARGRGNNFLIDGLLNNDISVTGQQYVIANNDELQEINFQTSNFSAEYGRAGGAVITQVTKSGTNHIHGTLAEVYLSEVFNASNNTQRINFANGSTTVLKPKYKENIPAFTVGGPVIIPKIYNGHDKTFFFGAGQWDRYSSGASQATFTVPTSAGYTTLQALSATCPNVAKYLSQLGDSRGSSGTGAANIDISVQASLASSTCNGSARTGQVVQVGNFVRTAQNVTLDNNHLVRIDHTPSQRQNMVFRWLWDNNTNSPAVIGINPSFDTNTANRTMSALFADTYQITSHLSNEFRFGYTRQKYEAPLVPGPALTLPTFSVGSITSLAASANYPQGRWANSFQYQNIVTYALGRHSIRGGVEFLRQLATQVSPFNTRGQYTYLQTPVTAAAGVTQTITSLANFIDDYAGPAGSASISFGNPRYHPNLFTMNFFLQDTYKVSPNLTLTYGMRYENYGMPANIFPRPAFAGFGDADITRAVKVKTDNNNFAPTVGFSYNPHDFLKGSFVIRGGYQVTYDPIYNNLLSNMNAGIPNTLSNAPITSVTTTATPRGYAALSQASLAPQTLTPYSAVSSQFDQNIRNQYYHHYSLGIQQQLPGKFVMDVAFVGNQGRQLLYSNYLNPALPNATNSTYGTISTTSYGTQTLRYYQNRGQIIIRQTGATSNYTGLQVQFRRFGFHTVAGQFNFTSSYTYSKALDEVSDPISSSYASSIYASRPQVLAGGLRNFDYGPADFDLRHVSSTVIQWRLPDVRNKALNVVAGGWSIAPILYVTSGQPYSVLNGLDRDLDGASANDRPNIGNPNAPVNTRAVITGTSDCSTGYYDPAKRTTAGTGCVSPTDVRWVQVAGYNVSGNIEGRNAVFTTRYLTLDANVLKKFKLKEGLNAELGGEFFNVTNNQNFTTPSASLNVNSNNGSNFQNFLLTNGGNRTFRVRGKIIF